MYMPPAMAPHEMTMSEDGVVTLSRARASTSGHGTRGMSAGRSACAAISFTETLSCLKWPLTREATLAVTRLLRSPVACNSRVNFFFPCGGNGGEHARARTAPAAVERAPIRASSGSVAIGGVSRRRLIAPKGEPAWRLLGQTRVTRRCGLHHPRPVRGTKKVAARSTAPAKR